MAELFRMTGVVNVAAAGAARTLREIDARAKLAASGLDTLGYSARSATDAITGLASIGAAAAALNVLISKAAEFEGDLRNLNTIMRVSDKDIRAYGESLRLMSTEMKVAVAPAEAARAAYLLASSGFGEAADNALVLASSVKAASAGLTDAATAAEGIASVLNAYNMSAAHAGRVSDIMFKTVEDGVVTFRELSDFIGTASPVAAQAGVSFEELGAAVASATRAMSNPSKVLVGLRGLLLKLLSPTKQAMQVYEQLGITVNETVLRQKGLVGTLKMINEASGGSVSTLRAVVEDARALTTALTLMRGEGKQVEEFYKNYSDASYIAGATDRALAEQQKSVRYQMNLLATEAEALTVVLGDKLLGGLEPLIFFLQGVVSALNTMPGAAQSVVTALLTITSASIAWRAFGDTVKTVQSYLEQYSKAAEALTGVGPGGRPASGSRSRAQIIADAEARRKREEEARAERLRQREKAAERRRLEAEARARAVAERQAIQNEARARAEAAKAAADQQKRAIRAAAAAANQTEQEKVKNAKGLTSLAKTNLDDANALVATEKAKAKPVVSEIIGKKREDYKASADRIKEWVKESVKTVNENAAQVSKAINEPYAAARKEQTEATREHTTAAARLARIEQEQSKRKTDAEAAYTKTVDRAKAVYERGARDAQAALKKAQDAAIARDVERSIKASKDHNAAYNAADSTYYKSIDNASERVASDYKRANDAYERDMAALREAHVKSQLAQTTKLQEKMLKDGQAKIQSEQTTKLAEITKAHKTELKAINAPVVAANNEYEKAVNAYSAELVREAEIRRMAAEKELSARDAAERARLEADDTFEKTRSKIQRKFDAERQNAMDAETRANKLARETADIARGRINKGYTRAVKGAKQTRSEREAAALKDYQDEMGALPEAPQAKVAEVRSQAEALRAEQAAALADARKQIESTAASNAKKIDKKLAGVGDKISALSPDDAKGAERLRKQQEKLMQEREGVLADSSRALADAETRHATALSQIDENEAKALDALNADRATSERAAAERLQKRMQEAADAEAADIAKYSRKKSTALERLDDQVAASELRNAAARESSIERLGKAQSLAEEEAGITRKDAIEKIAKKEEKALETIALEREQAAQDLAEAQQDVITKQQEKAATQDAANFGIADLQRRTEEKRQEVILGAEADKTALEQRLAEETERKRQEIIADGGRTLTQKEMEKAEEFSRRRLDLLTDADARHRQAMDDAEKTYAQTTKTLNDDLIRKDEEIFRERQDAMGKAQDKYNETMQGLRDERFQAVADATGRQETVVTGADSAIATARKNAQDAKDRMDKADSGLAAAQVEYDTKMAGLEAEKAAVLKNIAKDAATGVEDLKKSIDAQYAPQIEAATQGVKAAEQAADAARAEYDAAVASQRTITEEARKATSGTADKIASVNDDLAKELTAIREEAAQRLSQVTTTVVDGEATGGRAPVPGSAAGAMDPGSKVAVAQDAYTKAMQERAKIMKEFKKAEQAALEFVKGERTIERSDASGKVLSTEINDEVKQRRQLKEALMAEQKKVIEGEKNLAAALAQMTILEQEAVRARKKVERFTEVRMDLNLEASQADDEVAAARKANGGNVPQDLLARRNRLINQESLAAAAEMTALQELALAEERRDIAAGGIPAQLRINSYQEDLALASERRALLEQEILALDKKSEAEYLAIRDRLQDANRALVAAVQSEVDARVALATATKEAAKIPSAIPKGMENRVLPQAAMDQLLTDRLNAEAAVRAAEQNVYKPGSSPQDAPSWFTDIKQVYGKDIPGLEADVASEQAGFKTFMESIQGEYDQAVKESDRARRQSLRDKAAKEIELIKEYHDALGLPMSETKKDVDRVVKKLRADIKSPITDAQLSPKAREIQQKIAEAQTGLNVAQRKLAQAYLAQSKNSAAAQEAELQLAVANRNLSVARVRAIEAEAHNTMVTERAAAIMATTGAKTPRVAGLARSGMAVATNAALSASSMGNPAALAGATSIMGDLGRIGAAAKAASVPIQLSGWQRFAGFMGREFGPIVTTAKDQVSGLFAMIGRGPLVVAAIVTAITLANDAIKRMGEEAKATGEEVARLDKAQHGLKKTLQEIGTKSAQEAFDSGWTSDMTDAARLQAQSITENLNKELTLRKDIEKFKVQYPAFADNSPNTDIESTQMDPKAAQICGELSAAANELGYEGVQNVRSANVLAQLIAKFTAESMRLQKLTSDLRDLEDNTGTRNASAAQQIQKETRMAEKAAAAMKQIEEIKKKGFIATPQEQQAAISSMVTPIMEGITSLNSVINTEREKWTKKVKEGAFKNEKDAAAALFLAIRDAVLKARDIPQAVKAVWGEYKDMVFTTVDEVVNKELEGLGKSVDAKETWIDKQIKLNVMSGDLEVATRQRVIDFIKGQEKQLLAIAGDNYVARTAIAKATADAIKTQEDKIVEAQKRAYEESVKWQETRDKNRVEGLRQDLAISQERVQLMISRQNGVITNEAALNKELDKQLKIKLALIDAEETAAIWDAKTPEQIAQAKELAKIRKEAAKEDIEDQRRGIRDSVNQNFSNILGMQNQIRDAQIEYYQEMINTLQEEGGKREEILQLMREQLSIQLEMLQAETELAILNAKTEEERALLRRIGELKQQALIRKTTAEVKKLNKTYEQGSEAQKKGSSSSGGSETSSNTTNGNETPYWQSGRIQSGAEGLSSMSSATGGSYFNYNPTQFGAKTLGGDNGSEGDTTASSVAADMARTASGAGIAAPSGTFEMPKTAADLAKSRDSEIAKQKADAAKAEEERKTRVRQKAERDARLMGMQTPTFGGTGWDVWDPKKAETAAKATVDAANSAVSTPPAGAVPAASVAPPESDKKALSGTPDPGTKSAPPAVEITSQKVQLQIDVNGQVKVVTDGKITQGTAAGVVNDLRVVDHITGAAGGRKGT